MRLRPLPDLLERDFWRPVGAEKSIGFLECISEPGAVPEYLVIFEPNSKVRLTGPLLCFKLRAGIRSQLFSSPE